MTDEIKVYSFEDLRGLRPEELASLSQEQIPVLSLKKIKLLTAELIEQYALRFAYPDEKYDANPTLAIQCFIMAYEKGNKEALNVLTLYIKQPIFGYLVPDPDEPEFLENLKSFTNCLCLELRSIYESDHDIGKDEIISYCKQLADIVDPKTKNGPMLLALDMIRLIKYYEKNKNKKLEYIDDNIGQIDDNIRQLKQIVLKVFGPVHIDMKYLNTMIEMIQKNITSENRSQAAKLLQTAKNLKLLLTAKNLKDQIDDTAFSEQDTLKTPPSARDSKPDKIPVVPQKPLKNPDNQRGKSDSCSCRF